MNDRRTPKIGEVMTKDPATIAVNATASEAENLMKKYQCRHLPVVEEGKAVGIVSSRDITLGKSILGKDSSEMLVRQVFVEFPYSADPETPLSRVLKDMAELAIGSALIMDGNELKGIFTSIDAFQVCAQILEEQ